MVLNGLRFYLESDKNESQHIDTIKPDASPQQIASEARSESVSYCGSKTALDSMRESPNNLPEPADSVYALDMLVSVPLRISNAEMPLKA